MLIINLFLLLTTLFCFHCLRYVQVAEFKHLLRVKLTPKNEYLCLPVLSHDRTLKLPKEYDTTTVWCLCTSIGRILGQSYMLAPMGLCIGGTNYMVIQ